MISRALKIGSYKSVKSGWIRESYSIIEKNPAIAGYNFTFLCSQGVTIHLLIDLAIIHKCNVKSGLPDFECSVHEQFSSFSLVVWARKRELVVETADGRPELLIISHFSISYLSTLLMTLESIFSLSIIKLTI